MACAGRSFWGCVHARALCHLRSRDVYGLCKPHACLQCSYAYFNLSAEICTSQSGSLQVKIWCYSNRAASCVHLQIIGSTAESSRHLCYAGKGMSHFERPLDNAYADTLAFQIHQRFRVMAASFLSAGTFIIELDACQHVSTSPGVIAEPM